MHTALGLHTRPGALCYGRMRRGHHRRQGLLLTSTNRKGLLPLRSLQHITPGCAKRFGSAERRHKLATSTQETSGGRGQQGVGQVCSMQGGAKGAAAEAGVRDAKRVTSLVDKRHPLGGHGLGRSYQTAPRRQHRIKGVLVLSSDHELVSKPLARNSKGVGRASRD